MLLNSVVCCNSIQTADFVCTYCICNIVQHTASWLLNWPGALGFYLQPITLVSIQCNLLAKNIIKTKRFDSQLLSSSVVEEVVFH